MKKIVITAGGTQEAIDKVRSITNKSTGKLASLIGQKFLELDDELEIIYIHGKGAKSIDANPLDMNRIKYIQINSADDLAYQVEKVLTENHIDAFVHTMAVADYSVDKVIDFNTFSDNLAVEVMTAFESVSSMKGFFKSKDELLSKSEFDELFKRSLEKSVVDTSSKMSSNRQSNAVILKRNKKIISMIKNLSPYTFLVGFKLMNDVVDGELIETGFNLLRENRCNLVFANDLSHIKAGNHDGYLVYPEKNTEYLSGKDNIAYMIAKETLKRGSVFHPQSVKIGENPVIPNEIYENIYSVGKSLYNSYLLPEVINYDRVGKDGKPHVGTYGNISVFVDDSIYMTGRNVHKGKLNVTDLALVVGVKEEKIEGDLRKTYAKVKYLGHKPSIDATIHSSIYRETNFKAILHIHTSKVFLGYPMVAESFPCGSDAERDAIIETIKKNPGTNVVQLYKHGLIIMGETLTHCYNTLTELHCNTLYVDYLNHDWDEGALAHFKEVGASDLITERDIYSLYYKNALVGNIFDKREIDFDIPEKKILNFAIITGDSVKGKGLGIVRKFLDLWENSYEMRLHTKEQCDIASMYIEKYGFTPMKIFLSKSEDHICLVKSPFPKVIGISGYSCAGKTGLCNTLMDEYDFMSLDCDSISRRVMAEPNVIKKLISVFGEEISTEVDGEVQIDRRKLAPLVFHNETERQKLNSIMYPKITEKIKSYLKTIKNSAVIIDAPTIYEVPEIMELCDKLILIKAEKDVLVERIARRDDISLEDAKARLSSQKGLLEYEKIADIIIDNSKNIPSHLIEANNLKKARETVRKIYN